jgi:ABC-type multidrug transport system fused ATPase/permease subunit
VLPFLYLQEGNLMLSIVMQHTRGRSRVSFFLAPLIMLCEVFCDLQQPTLMSHIIDNGLAKGDMHYVLVQASWMLLFAVLGLAAGGLCGVLGSYASLNMGAALREHMLTISLNSRKAGGLAPDTLITRITNDVTQMQNLVMMITRGMVRSPMLMLGGIVMSVLVCPRLAPILLIALPILVIFMLVIVRRSLPLYTHMQQQVDGINRVMRENLQGVKTIKAFVLEPHQQQQFTQANAELTQSSQNAAMATVMLAPVIQLVLNLGVIVALAYGGSLAISKTISDGQIIAFVNYMIQITTAMIGTVNIITAFSRAITSAARVQDVLAESAEELAVGSSANAPQDSSLVFKHVTFTYAEGSAPVLEDVNFTLPDGQWLGIIGTTGSGKTTLVQLLTRAFDEYAGSITIGGRNVRQLDLAAVHSKVAVATQDALLFSGSVRSNLQYGVPGADTTVLDQASAAAAADEFLHGDYDGHVEQKAKNFSGGQRQRLNIARALVTARDILVLDDATSAVDQTTNAEIQHRLETTRAHRSTIIISQRVSNIMHCKQILVLENGRVTARGSHEQLIASSPFYARLVATQLGGDAHANA